VNSVRVALALGAIPIIVGLIYVAAPVVNDAHYADAAGATMLIALGLAMGFGMLVILRGARDL
jgi:hypothetical protein